MKTVGDVLRSADPLDHEASWSPAERLAVEQRVLNWSPAPARDWSRRKWVTAMATAVFIAGLAVAPRFSSSSLQAAVGFEVRLAEDSPAPGLQPVTIPEFGRVIYLRGEAVVTNADIAAIRVVPGSSPSTFGVAITLTANGAGKMLEATSDHVGKPAVILIEGEVAAVIAVRSRIGREALITGNFARAEAERIAGGMVGR
jgi:hypothetical protein